MKNSDFVLFILIEETRENTFMIKSGMSQIH